MTANYRKVYLIILVFTAMIFSGCAASIPYVSKDQINLHGKLSEQKMKVAVVPFTLRTASDVKNVAFDDFDVELTNKFTEIIWKKNKVRIAKKNDVLEVMREINLTYNEIDPEMEDLPTKPNVSKIVELGKKLESDVVFLGTIRKNEFSYEGGPIFFFPSFLAKKRIYNIGAQMMAVDVEKGEFLAFDHINNQLSISSKLFSITGKVSDKKLAEGKQELLLKCGFALAYYAPMPVQRTDKKAIILQTGAALLNAFAGTAFSVETSITDDTWKMYPPNFFIENFGYLRSDVNKIPH